MPIETPTHERCPFCANIAGAIQQAVVVQDDDTFAFLNPRQSGLGHTLIIPKRHAATILDLQVEEAQAIMRQVHRVAHAISRALDPAGLNIFQNNGITAGQSVGHYHVQIVPSYPGDQPGRIFDSRQMERTPIEERLALGERIAAHMTAV